jgi:hypothetical protein
MDGCTGGPTLSNMTRRRPRADTRIELQPGTQMNPMTPRLVSARSDQTTRHESEWSRTVASIRTMLAGFERPRGALDDKVKEKQAKAAAWVTGLIDKLVSAATAETEAAVELARAEADAAVTQAQALVGHLMSESEAQRQEISELQQLLEAEKARNRRMAVAFDAFRRAVSFVEPIESASQTPCPAQESLQHLEPGDMERHVGPHATPEPALLVSDSAASEQTRMAPPAAAPIRPFTLASTTSDADSNTRLAGYVSELFDHVESSYWIDLNGGMRPADIVDRLTESLRRAHDAFSQRVSSADSSERTLFHETLTTLLDSKAATSFGRHLAAAAYSFAPPTSAA